MITQLNQSTPGMFDVIESNCDFYKIYLEESVGIWNWKRAALSAHAQRETGFVNFGNLTLDSGILIVNGSIILPA